MKLLPYPLSCLVVAIALGCVPGNAPVQTTAVQTASTPTPVARTPAPAAVTPEATPVSTTRLWLAYGDSITDDAFRDPVAWQTSFPEGAPRAVNSGMRGATTTHALDKLDEVLKAYPSARHAGVAFGTNDAYMEMPVATFKDNLRRLVQDLRDRGVTPVLATIPYSPHARMTKLDAYNAAIREVEREFGLTPGPDLFAWFQAHPEQVSPDQIHMTEAGSEAIQRLWAETARRLSW